MLADGTGTGTDVALRRRARRRYSPSVAVQLREDEDLARAFVRGDDDALRQIYERHGALVYGYCRKAVGADLAADATQEVFVAAWRSRERFDASRGGLAGWLVGIARFKVVDQIRARERHPSPTADTPEPATSEPSDLDRVADRMLVDAALAQLPKRARSVLELAFLGDHTHVEIAEKTGIPLGTIKSDIRRGLARLRAELEGFDAVGS
jgi:RNA polymerase sigma-70 factor (ECF subfamily)